MIVCMYASVCMSDFMCASMSACVCVCEVVKDGFIDEEGQGFFNYLGED